MPAAWPEAAMGIRLMKKITVHEKADRRGRGSWFGILASQGGGRIGVSHRNTISCRELKQRAYLMAVHRRFRAPCPTQAVRRRGPLGIWLLIFQRCWQFSSSAGGSSPGREAPRPCSQIRKNAVEHAGSTAVAPGNLPRRYQLDTDQASEYFDQDEIAERNGRKPSGGIHG